MSDNYKVEVVPSPKSDLGEGPHWDEGTQSLYYNDIYGKEASILRYDFKENKVYSAKIDGEPVVSFIIPVANAVDQYAVGIGRRVGKKWNFKLIYFISFIFSIIIEMICISIELLILVKSTR